MAVSAAVSAGLHADSHLMPAPDASNHTLLPSLIFTHSASADAKRSPHKSDNGLFLPRPRSAEVPLDVGFKFGKAVNPQMDFIGTIKGGMGLGEANKISVVVEVPPAQLRSPPISLGLNAKSLQKLPTVSKGDSDFELIESNALCYNAEPRTQSKPDVFNSKMTSLQQEIPVDVKVRFGKSTRSHVKDLAAIKRTSKDANLPQSDVRNNDTEFDLESRAKAWMAPMQVVTDQRLVVHADAPEQQLQPITIDDAMDFEEPSISKEAANHQNNHVVDTQDPEQIHTEDGSKLETSTLCRDAEVLPDYEPPKHQRTIVEVTGLGIAGEVGTSQPRNGSHSPGNTSALSRKPTVDSTQRISKQRGRIPSHRPSSRAGPPSTTYTTVDIVKILGQKLEQEQKQVADAAAQACRELEDANNVLQRENHVLKQELHESLEKRKASEADLIVQKESIKKLHTKANGFAVYMKGLGSDMTDLRREYTLLKEEHFKISTEHAHQTEEYQGECRQNILMNEQRLKCIRRDHKEIKSDALSQIVSLQRFNDELGARFCEKACELSEEKDRNVRLQQQSERISTEYIKISTSIDKSNEGLLAEIRAMSDKVETREQSDDLHKHLEQVLRACEAGDTAQRHMLNKIKDVEGSLSSLTPTIESSLKGMINNLATSETSHNLNETKILIQNLRDDVLRVQALQARVFTMQATISDLEHQEQQSSVSLADMQSSCDEKTAQLLALENLNGQQRSQIECMTESLAQGQDREAKLQATRHQVNQQAKEILDLKETVCDREAQYQIELEVFAESKRDGEAERQTLEKALINANARQTSLEEQYKESKKIAQDNLTSTAIDLSAAEGARKSLKDRVHVLQDNINTLHRENFATATEMESLSKTLERIKEDAVDEKQYHADELNQLTDQQKSSTARILELSENLEISRDAVLDLQQKLQQSSEQYQSSLQSLQRANNGLATEQKKLSLELTDRNSQLKKANEEKAAIESDCQFINKQLQDSRLRAKEKNTELNSVSKKLQEVEKSADAVQHAWTTNSSELEACRKRILELQATQTSTQSETQADETVQLHRGPSLGPLQVQSARRKADRHGSSLQPASIKLILHAPDGKVTKDQGINPGKSTTTLLQPSQTKDGILQASGQGTSQIASSIGSVFDTLGIIEPEAASMAAASTSIIPETQLSSERDISMLELDGLRRGPKPLANAFEPSSPLSEVDSPRREDVQVPASPSQSSAEYHEIMAGFDITANRHGATPNSASKRLRAKISPLKGNASGDEQLPTPSTGDQASIVLDSQPVDTVKKLTRSVRFTDSTKSSSNSPKSDVAQPYVHRGPSSTNKLTTHALQSAQQTNGRSGSSLKRSTSTRGDELLSSNKRLKSDDSDDGVVIVKRNVINKDVSQLENNAFSKPTASPTHPQTRLRSSKSTSAQMQGNVAPSKGPSGAVRKQKPAKSDRYDLRYHQVLDLEPSSSEEQ